jgi:hypothetical protein
VATVFKGVPSVSVRSIVRKTGRCDLLNPGQVEALLSAEVFCFERGLFLGLFEQLKRMDLSVVQAMITTAPMPFPNVLFEIGSMKLPGWHWAYWVTGDIIRCIVARPGQATVFVAESSGDQMWVKVGVAICAFAISDCKRISITPTGEVLRGLPAVWASQGGPVRRVVNLRPGVQVARYAALLARVARRRHSVRAHKRTLASGREVLVVAHERGNEACGRVEKEYSVGSPLEGSTCPSAL